MDSKPHRSLNLFTPGPVNLSRAALEGLGAPTIHHRMEEFEALYGSFREDLRVAFRCSGEVAVLTTSGTGGMEAAVACLLRSGEKALIPVSGKFSERWANLCGIYGVRPVVVEIGAGLSPGPEEIETNLKTHDVSSVLLTHCETSTAALTDLKAIAEVVREASKRQGREITIIVDCISTFCVDELMMEAWDLDCCISCSQKGLLSPPGLAVVALNQKAMDLLKRNSPKAYYLNLANYVGGNYYPFTPAVNVIKAAYSSLHQILSVGLDNVWRHYKEVSGAISDLLISAGFRPVAKVHGNAVVAFWSASVDPIKLGTMLRQRHGIVIAQGQADLRGRIFRISPLGKNAGDLEALGIALAEILGAFGREIKANSLEHYKKVVGREKVRW